MSDRKSASHGEAGYERRQNNAYFTEAWVTQALLEAIGLRSSENQYRRDVMVWEPACGDGRMAREIEAAGYQVFASDIADWGYGQSGWDFLTIPRSRIPIHDAIVTNPPFGSDARRFIERAIELTQARQGMVAMLQRHEFDAPISNHPLFKPPFVAKLVLPRRPRWVDGDQTASPRFPYAWYVWDWKYAGTLPILKYLPDLRPRAIGRRA